MEQKPIILWFIGLSGAGKTTLAKKLCDRLDQSGKSYCYMDGDVIRAQTKNNSFTREGRLEHLRNMAQLAKEASEDCNLVIGAFITPYEDARDHLRKSLENYYEIWVDSPLADCEKRDVKGLYAKARRNEISSFTGISDPFEKPQKADIHLKTHGKSEEESFQELMIDLNKLFPGRF